MHFYIGPLQLFEAISDKNFHKHCTNNHFEKSFNLSVFMPSLKQNLTAPYFNTLMWALPVFTVTSVDGDNCSQCSVI